MSVFDPRPLGRTPSLCVLALAIAIVGPAVAQPAATVHVRFSLDGRFEGPAALFLAPLDRGYFKSERLDVTIDDAGTFLEPITRVASGGHEIGLADINAVIRYRDQNPSAQLRTVFIVYNKPPYAIVGRKSRGISVPKSLEGKRLGAPPTAATFPQWPIFAKLNDIDTPRVILENIATPVRVPMLAAGQLDAALGYSYRLYVDLKDRGVPVDDIVQMQMANHGLKLYGTAIIVNARFAAEQPEAVKGFLRATIRGIRDVSRNPAGAIESVLRREELAKKDVELERLRLVVRENVLTPEVRANGYGAIDPARMEEAISQIALSYAFKARPKAETVFDPSFLPPAGERRAH
jgi:NitT/TauT family transport system substrate-binding protein